MQLSLCMHDLSMLVTRELSDRQTIALAREEEEGSLTSVARWLPRPWRGHRGPVGNTAGRHMPVAMLGRSGALIRSKNQ